MTYFDRLKAIYIVDGGRYTAFARLFFRRAASCETTEGGIGLLHPPELFEIRNRNLAEVLAALRRSAPCSLAQIVEETEIGLTTVKKCIEQCVASGMVLHGESAASTGGRKAQQYLLNPKYQYYLMLLTDNNTLGVAILAAVGAGIYKNVEAACDVMVQKNDNALLPVPENTAIYRQYHALYENLYASLKDDFQALAAL